MKCIMEGFEPFDKFWFRTCFYQAFLSIAKYFGGNLNKYFSNQIFEYEEMDTGHLMIVRKNIVHYTEVEGIKERKLKQVKNIIPEIECAIEEGHPVIIATDTYYVPHRNDTYLTQHGIHYICIYGFDNKTRRFNILDHASWGSYKYEKKEMLYSDALTAYTAYSKDHPDEYTFFAYSKGGQVKEGKRPVYDNNELLANYMQKFKTDLEREDVGYEGYRLFFEGETWVRIPVMEMYLAIGEEECYSVFSALINTAKMIFVIMTRDRHRKMSKEVKQKLSGYADRFLRLKRETDQAEKKYYARIEH